MLHRVSKPLLVNELKDAFFLLKLNKSSRVDDASFNIIKKCLGVYCEPLIYLFQLSLEKGVFPDDLKIAKVTLIYKAGDNGDISIYRSISVLPCISKTLESLMNNRFYNYLKENKISYKIQFGFQGVYSTSDTSVQLVDKFLILLKKSS